MVCREKHEPRPTPPHPNPPYLHTFRPQRQLQPEFRKRIDIEAVCRGFLDVAKVATKALVESIFNGEMAGCAGRSEWKTVRGRGGEVGFATEPPTYLNLQPLDYNVATY